MRGATSATSAVRLQHEDGEASASPLCAAEAQLFRQDGNSTEKVKTRYLKQRKGKQSETDCSIWHQIPGSPEG